MRNLVQPIAEYEAEAPTPFGLGLHHVLLAIPAGTEDDCRAFYLDI